MERSRYRQFSVGQGKIDLNACQVFMVVHPPSTYSNSLTSILRAPSFRSTYFHRSHQLSHLRPVLYYSVIGIMVSHSPLFLAIWIAVLENKYANADGESCARLTEAEVVHVAHRPCKSPGLMPRFPRGNQLQRARHNIGQPQWRGSSH